MNAILAAGLDRQPDAEEAPRQLTLPEHGNIRGKEYYNNALNQEENHA